MSVPGLPGTAPSVPGPAVPVLLWLAVAAVTAWSAIAPKDVLTWWLEALPALIVLVLLPSIHGRFRLTTLAYVLVAMHAVVLLVGAHYTYAEVPLFDWVRDAYGLARNTLPSGWAGWRQSVATFFRSPSPSGEGFNLHLHRRA